MQVVRIRERLNPIDGRHWGRSTASGSYSTGVLVQRTRPHGCQAGMRDVDATVAFDRSLRNKI